MLKVHGSILALVGYLLVEESLHKFEVLIFLIYLVTSLHVVAKGYWNKYLKCIKGSAGPIVEKFTVWLVDQ